MLSANRFSSWPHITLPESNEVSLRGPLQRSFKLGIARMGLAPYSAEWLLSDVSFKIKRIFTNYSGDVSGRFLQLCSLTGAPTPDVLPAVIKDIIQYQKPDGHFGVTIDWSKPLKRGDSTITMLWGNARLLVGLVTAAEKFHNEALLSAARCLGNFYVNTADRLCDPDKIAFYKSSGNYGDGYSCCYFPAIEGLTMLYQATKDERYLQQAERMAKFFLNFDVLPVDHSSGNLCTWRGILDLYLVTHHKNYLEEAINKWNEAVDNGFVWPLGGIGEHWYVKYQEDEGCAESDWLRFNLMLWRFTVDNRYLDLAQRLLENQYLYNQLPDGGYGSRHYDVDNTGPIGTYGAVSEWYFCCNFAGPLGLYFFKKYLAASDGNTIYINFPFSFSTSVTINGNTWNVSVNTTPDFNNLDEKKLVIHVASKDAKSHQPVKVLLRIPSDVTVEKIDGKNNYHQVLQKSYLVLTSDLESKKDFTVIFKAKLRIEGRRFTGFQISRDRIYHLKNVSLMLGSKLLYQMPAQSDSVSTILATVDKNGHLGLLQKKGNDYLSLVLPTLNVSKEQIANDIATAQKVSLLTGPPANSNTKRVAFIYNLVVVPQRMITPSMLAHFDKKVLVSSVAHYGKSLEKDPNLWPQYQGWKFTPDGILIDKSAWGEPIGLITGKGYKDYKFSFDVTLPEKGAGTTGWVIRSKNDYNYITFQLQSADVKYQPAGYSYTVKANTLQPMICIDGKISIQPPVVLPEEIRKGKLYHIVTTCLGNKISVFINGKQVFSHAYNGLNEGAPGFRVSGKSDQGLFNNISLIKL